MSYYVIRDKDRISKIQKRMIERSPGDPRLRLDFISQVSEIKKGEGVDIPKDVLEFLNKNKVGVGDGLETGDTRNLIREFIRIISYQNQALRLKYRGLKPFQRKYITNELIKPFKERIYKMAGLEPYKMFPREKYIAFKKTEAENKGRGRNFELPENAVEAQIKSIKESLDRWLNYFASNDSDVFPPWFKYWALMGVIKLASQQNKEDKYTFPKREKDTFNEFPQLNPGALALCLDHIRSTVQKTGDAPKESLKSQNFQNIYTHYYNKILSEKSKDLLVTEGKWVRYPKGSEPKKLVSSIEGWGTSWCTEGYAIAKSQLQEGNIDVYYSYDKSGNPKIPRIAVRWEGNYIVEVRGIGPDQEIDPQILANDVLRKKLDEYGEVGNVYLKTLEDMKRLTTIFRAFKTDISYKISEEDMAFVESKPIGFLQSKKEDPRSQQILSLIELREKYNLQELDEETIDLIISEPHGGNLAYVVNFINLSLHLYIANKLIDVGQVKAVAENLSNFKGLDTSVADRLIDEGQEKAVARNLENFKDLNYKEIADKLIERGKESVVAEYLEKFRDLDHINIADRLIERGKAWVVAEFLINFRGLDAYIANRLIDESQGSAVAENLRRFSGLNHFEIANKLIDARKGEAVVENLEDFRGLNHVQIANKLIDTRQGWDVAEYLEKFRGLKHIDIAYRLINTRQGIAVARYLKKFSGLNHVEIANKLIEKSQGEFVAQYLENFKDLNHVEIANKLIEKSQGEFVAQYLENFKDLNHVEIADRLIDARQVGVVAQYLKNFNGLNHIEIANRLIDTGQGGVVAQFLKNFSGLNHIEIANRLIDTGQGWAVAQNLEKFRGLDHNNIAKRLINTSKGYIVLLVLSQFKGLNEYTAIDLILYNYPNGWRKTRDETIDYLKQHPQSFNFDINQIDELL